MDSLRKRVVMIDGGLGTTLEEEYGVQFSSTSTPLWSSHLLISSPQTLLDLQTRFAKTGVDILLTATYQASHHGFSITPRVEDTDHTPGQIGYDQTEAETYMRSAISIARSAFAAVGKRGVIALSLGAYGATMIPSQEYTGDYGSSMTDWTDLFEFHNDRMACFTNDGETWNNIDLISFETLPRLSEVRAAREVMNNLYRSNKTNKKFWISCVFANDDNKLADGSSIEEVVKEMTSEERGTALPYAIGINCTKLPKLRKLIGLFEAAASKMELTLPHLVVYPDGAGKFAYDTSLQQWVAREMDSSSAGPFKEWDEDVCDIVEQVQLRGVWKGILVGGCCKTTPKHIAQLRDRIDRSETPKQGEQ